VSSVVASRAVLAGYAALLLGGAPLVAAADPMPPQRPSFPVLPAPPEVTGLAGLSPAMPEGRTRFLPLITAEAKARGLPPEVADAVARVESGYSSAALGSSGERGMMQVMPPTAAMLGFKGTLDQLAEPSTNIRLGVTYLAEAWRLARGDLCRALMKYRAGHNEERMSALSVEYCRRAKSHLAALGSPLGAGALPAADFGIAPFGRATAGTGGVRRVAGRLVRVGAARTGTTSRRFWAAHTARIKAIEARLPWKHGGIMAGG
jgi:hypothetical protein